MLQILKNRLKAKMPSNSNHASHTSKPSSTFTVPGMYLFHKYNEFKRQQQELHRKKVTEKELEHLNQKIDRLLSKIDDRDFELTPGEDDEECVICMNAKATMETHPCGHRVICRKCFIKTIQAAVAQRCLPLKCVICRTRILKLRQPAYMKVSSSTLQKLRSSEGHSKSPKPSRIYAK